MKSWKRRTLLRNLSYGLVAVVLAGGWFYFYTQSRAVDPSAANRAFATLDELRALDRRWNDRLVRARIAPRVGTAPVAPVQGGAGTLHARLQSQIFEFTSRVPGSELSELKRAFDEKGALVERYTAVYDEFARAFHGFSAERQLLVRIAGEKSFAAGAEPAPGIAGVLDDIARRVANFASEPSAEAAAQVRARIAVAASAPVPDTLRPRMDAFLRVARRMIEQRSESEALFEQAWFAPTGPRLDLVTRSLENALGASLDENELNRFFLLYYSGFLVVVLGYLVYGLAASRLQIDRINRQLREANESLEQRVALRTRELSEALAKLKESEALLVQTEKMSSLGRMVAGIAHEVNTPLAYVKASLEAVRGRIADNARLAAETDALLGLLSDENPDAARLEAQFSAVRDLIESLRARRADEEIGNAVKDGLYGIQQISDIVTNLRDFSRLDRSKTGDYDLHAGIESTLRIAHDVLRKRKVIKEFGKVPHITCSPSQINQVLLNLISNAAQATRDGEGMIILQTGANGREEVWVEVIDNGAGIAPEALPKIFDPFFTTKEVGKGTGLGLSISYKIVQSHGGRLEVESKVGVGTRFRVTLPVARAAAAA
ncbi:MAG: hypothetical protein IT514_10895 [Burkholderiales bacterium]|nr:hypothetical protein [Burkholderiales bacterium]